MLNKQLLPIDVWMSLWLPSAGAVQKSFFWTQWCSREVCVLTCQIKMSALINALEAGWEGGARCRCLSLSGRRSVFHHSGNHQAATVVPGHGENPAQHKKMHCLGLKASMLDLLMVSVWLMTVCPWLQDFPLLPSLFYSPHDWTTGHGSRVLFQFEHLLADTVILRFICPLSCTSTAKLAAIVHLILPRVWCLCVEALM